LKLVKDENAIGEEIVRFVEGRIGEGGLVNWSGFFFVTVILLLLL
jgi:hypothetical protein